MSDQPDEPRLEDTGAMRRLQSQIDPEHVVRMAACLDVDPEPVLASGVLPTLWHWGFFVPAAPTAELGDDGHRRRRPEMAAFPRRMFGAGRTTVAAPLRIGEPAERTSEVRRSALKDGRSGRFWAITVGHRVTQRGELVIDEEQDILLRSPGPSPALSVERDEQPDAPWVESLLPTEALLFRFAAVTFNAHRIHYDHGYATDVEGYPALVVPGPLTAIALAAMAERRSGRPVRALAFRATAPLFVDRRIWLTGTPSPTGATMTAWAGDHTVAMSMDVELA